MAKAKEAGKDAGGVESLVKTAEKQGLPRSVAEEVVDDALSEGVASEKLKEVVEEAAAVEKEDREQASGHKD